MPKYIVLSFKVLYIILVLFIIYINDIAHASKLFDFIIYADDATLSGTLKIIFRNTDNKDINDVINEELK